MISFNCRQCQEFLEVPDSVGGTSVECPKCGIQSVVPKPSTATTSPTAPPRKTSSSGGLFDALLGNASQMSHKKVVEEVNHILVAGERVELGYKLIRDLFVFTDRRLILIDKQGLTGKKMECHSIPYRSIVHFSVETAGTFDRDAELKIFVSGSPVPIEKQFRKGGADIYDVQRALATAIVGR